MTISKAFYLGQYEVTQAQWHAVMDSYPSDHEFGDYGEGNDYPVHCVSWNDCQTFISKLNEMGQGTFRLPTEAEWEYACRAGTATRFYWGDDPSYTSINDYAWYFDEGVSLYGIKVVGQKTPNPWGLYDMSGNLWEFCADWFGSIYYSTSPSVDPEGPD